MNYMLYLGSDHAGFALKEKIKTWLTDLGQPFTDLGPTTFEPGDDYPLYAKPVAEKVAAGAGQGILVCDTGEGMVISANKFPGVRAALVVDELTASKSREHNDSNVLVLGAELQTDDEAKAWLQLWLKTSFSGEARHERRLDEIKDLEK